MQGHFQLRGIAHHVIVGEDMSFFIDDEARPLAFLGHRSIKEVVGRGFGGDIDHRRDHAMINIDVVLLFGIKLLRPGGFAEFDVRGTRNQVRSGIRTLMMGGKPIERSCQKRAQDKRSYKFHAVMRFQSVRDSRIEIDVACKKV